MITTGIFTRDFQPEDQYKAKTYECMNCTLVSEFNYCIDCNHCICTECLKTIKKCPLDNRIIDENTSFSFNFIGSNLLEALKVYCIYKYNGCPWEGTKKQLEEMHYSKCPYQDNKRKLEINMNNYNIFENNNVINNVEEHINNATKMILRKKPKKRNIEFDEDSNEESSYSNFSQRYLGKDEESVVEVDSDVDFRKNKYDFIQVKDLAYQIASVACQTEVTGTINCCTGKPVALADQVESFIKEHNFKIKLDYGAFPDRPYDSPEVWGDPTKINKILGINS